MHVDILDVHAVNEYIAVIVVVIAHEQVYQRGLAGACCTDDTDDIAGLYRQIDVFKRFLCTVEGKADIFEFYFSLHIGENMSLAEIVLRLGVKNVKYAFGRSERRLVGVVEVCEEVYRTVEHGGVGYE